MPGRQIRESIAAAGVDLDQRQLLVGQVRISCGREQNARTRNW